MSSKKTKQKKKLAPALMKLQIQSRAIGINSLRLESQPNILRKVKTVRVLDEAEVPYPLFGPK